MNTESLPPFVELACEVADDLEGRLKCLIGAVFVGSDSKVLNHLTERVLDGIGSLWIVAGDHRADLADYADSKVREAPELTWLLQTVLGQAELDPRWN